LNSIAIFLSARNKSTRLPHKQLLKIGELTVTEILIERLKLAKGVPVVLCTSTNSDDEPLVKIAEKSGIKWFKGSEKDKLDRYLKAAEKFGVDFAVVVDGDDILCDIYAVNSCIDAYTTTQADFITVSGLPLGATPFGIKIDALRDVCTIKLENDTEVWGSYFTDTGRFDCHIMGVKDDQVRRPDIRLTLDYKEDFIVIESVIKHFNRLDFSIKDVVSFLSNNPDLINSNKEVHKQYLEHLKQSAKARVSN
jgi:spore coat polysaccharide biosynthesis protein SpsF